MFGVVSVFDALKYCSSIIYVCLVLVYFFFLSTLSFFFFPFLLQPGYGQISHKSKLKNVNVLNAYVRIL